MKKGLRNEDGLSRLGLIIIVCVLILAFYFLIKARFSGSKTMKIENQVVGYINTTFDEIETFNEEESNENKTVRTVVVDSSKSGDGIDGIDDETKLKIKGAFENMTTNEIKEATLKAKDNN